MKTEMRALLPLIAAASLLAGACGGLGSSTHKVIFNEGVCDNVRFLQMKVNETNRVVLDNRKHAEGQMGMTATLKKFPVIVQGEVPEGSTIGDKVSTILLKAQPGEQMSVDLLPTFTGTYSATCGTSQKQGEGGAQIRQHDIQIQIK
jgi:hypothetical protein